MVGNRAQVSFTIFKMTHPTPSHLRSALQQQRRNIEENFKIPCVLQKYREISPFSKSFPGPWKNISKFQEYREIICFSKSFPEPWKKFPIPGVFQEYREFICFSRSFSGPQRKISKYHVFSRNTGILSVFPTIFQRPGKKFQFYKFPGVQGNFLYFQEISRALEENFKIPGVQGNYLTGFSIEENVKIQ